MHDNGSFDEVGDDRRPRTIFYSHRDDSKCTRTLTITSAD
jgi:hypothetical protein